MTLSRASRAISISAAPLAVSLLLTGSAAATFPGRNGPIVFEYVRGEGWGSVDPVTGQIAERRMPPGRLLPAFDPAPSPDGLTFAFVRGRGVTDGTFRHFDVWTVGADGRGGHRVLPDASDPAWSPDGSRLLVLRGPPTGPGGVVLARPLWTVRSDGSGRRRVGGVRADFARWSPDGRRILFGRPGTSELFSVRPDGRGLRVWPGPRGLLSPDGETVAVADGDDVVVIRVADGARRRLTTASDPARVFVQPRAWAPDGRSLAVVETTHWHVPTGGLFPASTIVRVDLATEERSHVEGNGLATVEWQARCTLAGNGRANRLRGTAGADLVCGLAGDDRVWGGAGVDRLFGHAGHDRIDARDGAFDVVGCGSGRDVALADRADVAGVDCERVLRARR